MTGPDDMSSHMTMTGLSAWVANHSVHIVVSTVSAIGALTGFGVTTQLRLDALESQAHDGSGLETTVLEIQRDLHTHDHENKVANARLECLIFSVAEDLPLTPCLD